VQAELRKEGAAVDRILAPPIEHFDFSREADETRMYAEMKPPVLIHLAAEVGCITVSERGIR
jgi:hypothetical protein